MFASLNEERKLWKRGFNKIAGLDEAGRGPLAGPVVAFAVLLEKNYKLEISKLKDSKQLTRSRREEIFEIIKSNPKIKWGKGIVSEKIIDKINIFQATRLAMKKAIGDLEKKNIIPDFMILDGKMELDLPLAQKSIVKGDEKVASCALASIMAKVTRDRIMAAYHEKYPQYGFNKHKGYPTQSHFRMLKKYGPSKIHRKSFAPVRESLS